ncbi:sugar phosphate isomerase [Haladaptatus sp. R4]|uniref:sugar phosphate isomerase/epimerase family protein n=1 Tax=Haladaptatus sp. R4 TaxID=1679489 RepID=UPI0007B46470|nr:sugar phosphate isomerase/epimerase [Haladaptatus sp. R4]KZN22592.1 sugar phosphate isomerase [Haladaptatus sp. R4]
MVRTAINVYSVRDLDESVPEVLERVANAGYDGVQFSGRHTPFEGDLEEIQETLAETGLDVTAAHIGADLLEQDLDNVVDTYETVGVSEAVVPYLPPKEFSSVERTKATAERLEALATELDVYGWELHYHNHEHEFVDLDGRKSFEIFLGATDIGIEPDVGWVLASGHDPVKLLKRLDNRAPFVHFKDVRLDPEANRGGHPVEIGAGDVDMAACAEAARNAGADWFIYEHDNPDDPKASIEHGAEFLSTL